MAEALLKSEFRKLQIVVGKNSTGSKNLSEVKKEKELILETENSVSFNLTSGNSTEYNIIGLNNVNNSCSIKAEESPMTNDEFLSRYIEKVDRDQSDLRADIREGERRTSEKISSVEERMDSRLNKIENLFVKMDEKITRLDEKLDDRLEKMDQKLDNSNKFVQNMALTVNIGVITIGIGVILGIITLFFSIIPLIGKPTNSNQTTPQSKGNTNKQSSLLIKSSPKN